MENTTETEVQDTSAADIQKKFDAQEETFQRTLTCHKTLRAFFEKHREAISPFNWKAYGWMDTEIEFDSWQDRGKAKEIATALGREGWTRHKNSYTCGAIDWKKELDGCGVIIKNAEQMTPKLIEQVKL